MHGLADHLACRAIWASDDLAAGLKALNDLETISVKEWAVLRDTITEPVCSPAQPPGFFFAGRSALSRRVFGALGAIAEQGGAGQQATQALEQQQQQAAANAQGDPAFGSLMRVPGVS